MSPCACFEALCANHVALGAVIALAVAGFLSLATLLVPWLLTFCTYRKQNLKKKYAAEWALVTGGSSGIGKSLCHKLAAQGLNLVVAAVPDKMFDATIKELKAAYPAVEIRQVTVDLSASDATKYMQPLEAATKDILVQIIFSNAGYMVTGFFTSTPVEKLLANHHCNATAGMVIAHHFARRMREAKARGCIVFTSSPANIIPSPFSVLYGCTKSYVTHMASSLACELGPEGIDVSVCHPSPVATNFYNGAHAMPTLNLFKGTAKGPDVVADVMLRGVGRTVFIDQGYYPIVMRLLGRIVEIASLTDLLKSIAHTIEDYRFLKAEEAKAAGAKPKAN